MLRVLRVSVIMVSMRLLLSMLMCRWFATITLLIRLGLRRLLFRKVRCRFIRLSMISVKVIFVILILSRVVMMVVRLRLTMLILTVRCYRDGFLLLARLFIRVIRFRRLYLILIFINDLLRVCLCLLLLSGVVIIGFVYRVRRVMGNFRVRRTVYLVGMLICIRWQL